MGKLRLTFPAHAGQSENDYLLCGHHGCLHNTGELKLFTATGMVSRTIRRRESSFYIMTDLNYADLTHMTKKHLALCEGLHGVSRIVREASFKFKLSALPRHTYSSSARLRYVIEMLDFTSIAP